MVVPSVEVSHLPSPRHQHTSTWMMAQLDAPSPALGQSLQQAECLVNHSGNPLSGTEIPIGCLRGIPGFTWKIIVSV